VYPRELADDSAYLCAMREVAQGHSPYLCSRYLYPPVLAQLTTASAAVISETSTLSLLRALSLIAGVWIIDFSLRAWALSPWARAGLCSLLLVWSPSLREALGVGNISPLVSALGIWALSRWTTRPVLAGLALGASVALKPVTLVAVVALLGHRPTATSRLAPQLKAAGFAVATLGLALWPGRHLLGELTRQPFVHSDAVHDVSLQRCAALLGVPLPAPLMLACVCAAALLYVRRGVTETTLLHVSCVATLIAQPVLWCHTLILAYPLFAGALHRALRGSRLSVLVGVALSVTCLASSDVFGDLSELVPRWLAVVLACTPTSLLLGLLCYVEARRGSPA
jgi:hypothetical protein